MEFTVAQPHVDDVSVAQVGKTVPLTVDGVVAGECVIKAIDQTNGEVRLTVEMDSTSPAARLIERGELRAGGYAVGTVGRRYPYSGWIAEERSRLDFSMRVQPRADR